MISRGLISQKLAGQELLVRDMLRDTTAANAIARFRTGLPTAESIETVRLIESQAARAYWQAWSAVPIRWPRKDELRVPAHWNLFGSRISPLTHSPRLAVNPPNALLNLLYSILEAESRLGLACLGLDPGIGVLHVDTAARDSLACDVMEVCRPQVDAFVLNWLQNEPFRKSDFWEDRNGNCRLVSALATRLAHTSHTWRKLVSPTAEYVAQELLTSIPNPRSHSPRQRIATRLTQRNKREAKGGDVPEAKQPKLEHVCRGCGKPVRPEHDHCADCAIDTATMRMVDAARVGRLTTNSPQANAKRANTQRQNALAQHSWKASSQPAWLTDQVYSEVIQPQLTKTSASAIAKQIGVSRWYAGRIRQGYRPHPRHWVALAQLVSFPLPDNPTDQEK